MSLSHAQRLRACLSEERLDRPPVALWRHFPVDDQHPASLAAAVIHFQRSYDFDLVKVTPASSFCLKDWGADDAWRGATEGTRDYTRTVIHAPEDWLRLPALPPDQGHLRSQLACLEMITGAMGEDTPVIQTIFNPLSQAKNLVGKADLQVHLRCHPQELHAALKTITETTIQFIDAVARRGAAGIFYAVQHAQYGLLSEQEYHQFGAPYDLQILEAVQNLAPSGLWFNMLHVHGEAVMFDLVSSYPVQSLNWHDRDTPPSLAEGLQRFPGVVCGGLSRERSLVLGTPAQIREEAQDAIHATRGRRFILGTGCVTPITAPHGNLLAARRSVEG
jgi:uroporphyrinogen decarboxylase